MPFILLKLINPSCEMFPVPESDLDLVDKAPDMDAGLGWEWKPSGAASFVDLTDMKDLNPEIRRLILSVTGWSYFAAACPSNGDPLTYSFARTLTPEADPVGLAIRTMPSYPDRLFFGQGDDVKIACPPANPLACFKPSVCRDLFSSLPAFIPHAEPLSSTFSSALHSTALHQRPAAPSFSTFRAYVPPPCSTTK
ncbi:hypothetical protein DFH09DRAFT_1068555 [Mycena vulgaris]|nr:hypothetical protein DFH09DRAFT_1068555 [Mycena vulgaris]